MGFSFTAKDCRGCYIHQIIFQNKYCEEKNFNFRPLEKITTSFYMHIKFEILLVYHLLY